MPARSAPTSGATTVTSAPASAHPLALATAGASPPTITQRRPSRRRKTGWVRIRPGIVPDAQGRGNAGPQARLGGELREPALEGGAGGLREAKLVAGRDRPAAAHHERREGRVQARQLGAAGAREPSRRLHAERALEAPLVHAQRRLLGRLAEGGLEVALHVEDRK